jgi:ADP-heptose:LPS heptosyltransferase
VEWLLFQRGPGLADWPHDYGTAPAISDILDEARQMQTLDLLLTVDTCSAHLAGALGVPVWTLLPHAADWRWMCGRSDSPWYPTMRLIRQRVPGDWSDVIPEVMMQIEKLS